MHTPMHASARSRIKGGAAEISRKVAAAQAQTTGVDGRVLSSSWCTGAMPSGAPGVASTTAPGSHVSQIPAAARAEPAPSRRLPATVCATYVSTGMAGPLPPPKRENCDVTSRYSPLPPTSGPTYGAHCATIFRMPCKPGRAGKPASCAGRATDSASTALSGESLAASGLAAPAAAEFQLGGGVARPVLADCRVALARGVKRTGSM